MLKVIQEVIEATRIQVSDEEAVLLWPKIKEFKINYGKEPSINANDPLERRMAEVLIYLNVPIKTLTYNKITLSQSTALAPSCW